MAEPSTTIATIVAYTIKIFSDAGRYRDYKFSRSDWNAMFPNNSVWSVALKDYLHNHIHYLMDLDNINKDSINDGYDKENSSYLVSTIRNFIYDSKLYQNYSFNKAVGQAYNKPKYIITNIDNANLTQDEIREYWILSTRWLLTYSAPNFSKVINPKYIEEQKKIVVDEKVKNPLDINEIGIESFEKYITTKNVIYALIIIAIIYFLIKGI